MMYNSLTMSLTALQPLPEHGVYTVFVELGNTKIEVNFIVCVCVCVCVCVMTTMFMCSCHQLLHPLGEKSPIESFLKKKPEGGIHHICLEVCPGNPHLILTISLYTGRRHL